MKFLQIIGGYSNLPSGLRGTRPPVPPVAEPLVFMEHSTAKNRDYGGDNLVHVCMRHPFSKSRERLGPLGSNVVGMWLDVH